MTQQNMKAGTSADLDTAVTALKTRLAAAQRARVRAEGERDAAAASAEAARTQLAAEFGVRTVEEAQTMLRELDTSLADELAALAAALDEIGA